MARGKLPRVDFDLSFPSTSRFHFGSRCSMDMHAFRKSLLLLPVALLGKPAALLHLKQAALVASHQR